MLIDRFMPDAELRTAHSIEIDAPAERVWDVAWSTDFSRIFVVKALAGLRSLPKLLASDRARKNQQFTLRELAKSEFGILEEREHETCFGVRGRFWRPSDNLMPFSREAFDHPAPPGLCHATWSFSVEAISESSSVLSTETRIECGDDSTRTKFRRYWFVVEPFSSWIRRLILREVKIEATARSSG